MTNIGYGIVGFIAGAIVGGVLVNQSIKAYYEDLISEYEEEKEVVEQKDRSEIIKDIKKRKNAKKKKQYVDYTSNRKYKTFTNEKESNKEQSCAKDADTDADSDSDSNIYTIFDSDFYENNDSINKVYLKFYEEDEVLCYENSEIFEKDEYLIFKGRISDYFGHMNERVMYIRNTNENTDYEITLIASSYDDAQEVSEADEH